jgi:hypothetical protein
MTAKMQNVKIAGEVVIVLTFSSHHAVLLRVEHRITRG